MSRYGQYDDSVVNFKDNWKSVGAIAADLVEKAKAGGK